MRRKIHSIKDYIFAHKILSITVVIIVVILVVIFRPKVATSLETSPIYKHSLVQSVAVSGSIDAQNKADLTFLTAGQLIYVGAKKNDVVRAGQLIAQIDTRTVQKNLETALLNVSEQKNTFDQTIYNNRDKILDDTMRRILANNQSDLTKAVNSVELQDLARQQSFLTAPIAGILTRADAIVAGAIVGPTTVYEVVDPKSLVFTMDVDEADIGKINVGQEVVISLDAYPTDSLTLPVDSIDYVSHTTANGATAYSVKVKMPNNNIAKYRLGLSGDAEITVPLSSIFNDNYVYVKKDKGYQKRKITLGLQNDIDAEVISGLQVGEMVITQPSKVPQDKIIK
jgi:RND family efflux transporter MFP subunit